MGEATYVVDAFREARVYVPQNNGYDTWQIVANEITVSAGQTVEVTVTSSGSGCTRADSVKLVRVA